MATLTFPTPLFCTHHQTTKRSRLFPSLAACNKRPLFCTHHQTTKRSRLITSLAACNKRRPWWAPLFRSVLSVNQRGSEDLMTASDSDDDVKDVTSTAATSFSSLTPEKARVMRRELRAMKIWHDSMYHSPIASRLASPDQG